MTRLFPLMVLVLLFSNTDTQAQVGIGNIARMNSFLKVYGGANSASLEYEATHGLVRQKVLEHTYHFTISNIEKIIVRKVEQGYSVEMLCDSLQPCVNDIDPQYNSTLLEGISYFFSNEEAANSFANLAESIIREDFKKQVAVTYTIAKDKKITPGISRPKEQQPAQLEKEQKQVTKKKKSPKGNHLSVNAYTDEVGNDEQKLLSLFGKKLTQILELAEKQELNNIAGAEIKGIKQSQVKLPRAKKNYINEYKGAACFIAEFGTKKYYEDLEVLYDEVRDEIEISLPPEYEPVDMAYEPVYENSDDEVFHTEYYHKEDLNKPSVVIRITPDGKNNTLFLRIGKR